MFVWILAVFAAFVVLERSIPGWPLPTVRTWWLRALVINACQIAVVVAAGLTWEHWFQRASLFHLPAYLSPWTAGIAAYFVATFVFYWWHRWRHRIDCLWLAFHQIHHSPRRIEVITSFYKHPVEMIANSIIGNS